MRKKIFIKKTIHYICIFMLMLLLTACTAQDFSQGTSGSNKQGKELQEEVVQENTQTADQELEENGLFMVTFLDSEEEIIRLYSYKTSKEYQFHFALSTSFMDKYGNLASSGNFTPGKVVLAGKMDEDGNLMKVQISDDIWEYEKVERYSIDEEKTIFTIAGTKYTWSDDLFVFSDEERITLEEIQPDDEITVVGLGKKILAVVLTTGHGTLKLTNTDLFEGSYLQLGQKIFAMITEDMAMDVPEGEYTLSVANNGWGGTEDISIKRGEETTVDLDSIKGDGPSYGEILFKVDVEDAEIYIDNKEIDPSKPVSLTYGKHRMSVLAEGYDTWTRTLYVNSPEATISIELEETDTEETSEEGSQSTQNSSQSSSQSTQNSSQSSSQPAGNSSGTNSGSSGSSSGSSRSSSSVDDDILSDYLSTLSSLLDSMY